MKRVVAVLLAGVVVAWAGLAASAGRATVAQAPARDTATPRTGTSRISGRVLAGDTGAAVRRAIVRLSSSELRDGRSAMTNAEGRYEFRDLPSGSYMLIAQKSGFLTMQLGAKQPDDVGKTVKVADAETARNADIVLLRAGAISGCVVDEFGDPVANASVRVMRYRSIGGTRRMSMAGASNTNDLGQYRAFGLPPGNYYVTAQAQLGSEIELADHAGYAATYYPGTPNAGEALAVQVTTGQDATNVDIMLAVVRTARISGIALDSQGRPPTTSTIAAVMQQSSLGGGGSSGYGRVQPDGAFTVPNLPPGDYVLTLTVPNQALRQTEWAQARVSVGGSDLSGVTLQASLGATIAGHLVLDGASPASAPKITVTAASQSSFDSYPGPSGPPAQVRDDGSFTLTGVFGERVFRVGGPITGWTLKAVYLNGRDVTDTPIAFEGRENLSGLQVVVTDRITHLTATVTDDRGQPVEAAYVVVFPDDPARWSAAGGSRFQRFGMARETTPYKADALPPADYIGVALPSLQNVDPWDPEVLERMRRNGVRFTLREGESRTLTLKLLETAR